MTRSIVELAGGGELPAARRPGHGSTGRTTGATPARVVERERADRRVACRGAMRAIQEVGARQHRCHQLLDAAIEVAGLRARSRRTASAARCRRRRTGGGRRGAPGSRRCARAQARSSATAAAGRRRSFRGSRVVREAGRRRTDPDLDAIEETRGTRTPTCRSRRSAATPPMYSSDSARARSMKVTTTSCVPALTFTGILRTAA